MTATQIFLLFLKERCSLKEYMFFRNTILSNHGNKYFKYRRLYTNTFVEDYLSRNNRALNNFMVRIFILAPNLIHNRRRNPRWAVIMNDYNDRQKENGKKVRFIEYKGKGMYVNYYRREWNKFLREYIEGDKKINSPFRKGEKYTFKLKERSFDG